MNFIKQHPVSGFIISMIGFAKINKQTPWYLRQYSHLELGKILLEKNKNHVYTNIFVYRKILLVKGINHLSSYKIIPLLVGITAANLDNIFSKKALKN